MKPNNAYRKEIDGLRTVAVLPVILYHAGLSWFSGGYVGVDVFFVISGYLITTIIYREIHNGEFSIINFYERRIRRIFPALFFILLLTIIFAWQWMTPLQFKRFSQSIISVNFMSSNIYFWQKAGYFASSSELRPLLHTWSLAIEEQFYLFFPLLLLLLKKIQHKALIIILALLTISSLLWADYISLVRPVEGFYLLPARAWELLFGSLLAISIHYWQAINHKIANILSIIGLVLIAYAIINFDQNVPFPSFWTLIPVGGTFLVIAFANPENLVGKLLGLRPMVTIGLISYSAYLWHWPIFSFARIRMFEPPSELIFIILAIVSLVFAYLSWKFIEQPFRNKQNFSRQKIFTIAFLMSCFFIAFGIVGHLTRGLPARLNPDAIAAAKYTDTGGARKNRACDAYTDPKNACSSSSDPSVILLGDSHANAISEQFTNALSQYELGLQDITHNGCPPIIGIYNPNNINNPNCSEGIKKVYNYIVGNPQIKTIVLVSRWVSTYENTPFDNQEGGVESRTMQEKHQRLTHQEAEDRYNLIGNLTNKIVNNLIENGKRVILVYPIPEVGWMVPEYLTKRRIHGMNKTGLSTSHAVFKARNKNVYKQLDRIQQHDNLLIIKPEILFCNNDIADRCIATKANLPLYADDDHLNHLGAELLSNYIISKMESRNWLNEN
ncbi:MAG: acyltransferase [Alphaproteobacteria bacterium]|nr:acyltransferase [Alphaproteobacteria bacterium]